MQTWIDLKMMLQSCRLQVVSFLCVSLCSFVSLLFSSCLFRFSTLLFVCRLWLWLLLINGYSHFMNIVRGFFSSSFLHHFSPFLFFFLLLASSICYRVPNARKSSKLLYFPVSARAYYWVLTRWQAAEAEKEQLPA